MSKQNFSLRSFIRGRSAEVISSAAKTTYCQLGNTQPLILTRDKSNPNDVNAVMCSTVLGEPCGYVAREHSALVASLMDSGNVLLARANGPCLCIARQILIWSEGEEEVEVEASFKVDREQKRTRSREREKERL